MAEEIKERIRFVIIRGRVVPIRQRKKKDDLKGEAGAAAAVGGAGVAANAANTRRVYHNARTGITINSKAYYPGDPRKIRLGPALVGYKKGKRFGHIGIEDIAKTDDGGRQFVISWLGVREKFRGQGLSKVLSKHGVAEMKRRGGTELLSNIFHRNALLGYNRKYDILSKEGRALKDGSILLHPTNKKEALRKVIKSMKTGSDSPIWRTTNLNKVPTSRLKPFMTGGMKARLGLGIAAALVGTAYAFSNRDKK